MPDQNWPDLECADCGGALKLQRKPPQWGDGWVYLCEHRPSCRGLMSAHPDGSPQGVPAPQEIRTARNHCHKVFDPLWRSADTLPCYRNSDKDKKALGTIRRTARWRSYRYMAHKLGIAEDDCHISHMTDLETLRKFYRIAKSTTPGEIREWAKAND